MTDPLTPPETFRIWFHASLAHTELTPSLREEAVARWRTLAEKAGLRALNDNQPKDITLQRTPPGETKASIRNVQYVVVEGLVEG